jgi:hypothetical protein
METNLSYRFGPTSTFSWNLRYGTEPSGIANVSQRQTFRTGFGVSHGFTPRIAASLGVNFVVDSYSQSGVISTYSQTTADISLGLSFKVNRALSLSASCQYISVAAPQNVSQEYTRSIAFIGANFNF